MPAKSPTTTGRKFPETAWIRCDLTDEHKKHMKSLKFEPKGALESLERLVEDGFKLTFSRDAKNDCVGAYLTSPKESESDPQLCLSARGPTLTSAIMVLLYKHFELLGEDWSSHIDKRGVADPWG
jgi:hypothetical protein